MDTLGNSVGQKRRGRPPKSTGPDTLISLRVDDDLMCALEYWRYSYLNLQAARDAFVYCSERHWRQPKRSGRTQKPAEKLKPLRSHIRVQRLSSDWGG